MMNMMGKMFENMSAEDKKRMEEMMPKMMSKFGPVPGCGPDMKNMKSMSDMMEFMMKQNSSRTENASDIPAEIRDLFEEWKGQIVEEIKNYKSQNASATVKEIADYFRLSEKSVEYFLQNSTDDKNYEVLKVKKTTNSCSLCETYVKQNETKPVVVMSCEGACLRGEIARKAANIICYDLAPEKTVRLCLGSALTKQAGQRSLVMNAQKIISLEGCPVDCGSRLLNGLELEGVHTEVIHTDALASFDKKLFGTNEVSEEEISKYAREAAEKIVKNL